MAVNVVETLRRALTELESEKVRLDRQIDALRSALGSTRADGRTAERPGAGRPRRRRRMSAAARRAVSQRMKAYWAQRRTVKGAAKSTPKTETKSKAERSAAKKST